MSAAFQCDLCGKGFLGHPVKCAEKEWQFGTRKPGIIRVQLTASPVPDLCAACFVIVCADSVDASQEFEIPRKKAT